MLFIFAPDNTGNIIINAKILTNTTSRTSIFKKNPSSSKKAALNELNEPSPESNPVVGIIGSTEVNITDLNANI
ncbi:MAG: hypothetical protein LBQ68_02205 [Clostridiales bacterium]|nr:hypothetical protein [Clostridiales bacterium]